MKEAFWAILGYKSEMLPGGLQRQVIIPNPTKRAMSFFVWLQGEGRKAGYDNAYFKRTYCHYSY
ncbi:MAG TPA: hypothetical protein VE135_13015 [Pyrinomonadaceae bacterium]|nr:hypothetical protein [Pyrinomonadaceae bacterium]